MSSTPLPIVGTPVAVVDQAFAKLQDAMAKYGGRLYDSQKNVQLFAQYTKAKGVDLATTACTVEQVFDLLLGACIDHINELQWERDPHLLREKLLIAKNKRQEARDTKKAQQDVLDNSESAFLERRAAAEKKAEQDKADALAKTVVEADLNMLIGNLQFTIGPNRIDYRYTEEIQRLLHSLRYKEDGKTNWVKTLKAVSGIINTLDSDGATALAQVKQAVSRGGR